MAFPLRRLSRGRRPNGYAEQNPAADVEGQDTCRKLCILSSIAFGWHLLPEQVPTTGITSITLADEAYADACQRRIKLLGRPLPGRMVPSVPMWSPILSVCKIPWPVWTMSLTPFWSKGMPREM